MGLSNDLISQFVKITKDDTKTKTETTVYGTAIVESDGSVYVKFDDSEQKTPVTKTTTVKNNDRVLVRIRNHTATIIGNSTSPSINNDVINTELLKIDTLVAENTVIKEKLTASEAEINKLTVKDTEITGKVTANEGEIANLKTNKLDATFASSTYATITSLDSTNATIANLEATHSNFETTTTGRLEAIEAVIGSVSTTSLDAEYANIDFANINMTAIEQFFSKSGMIDNLVVGNDTITGELVGVTISGDLIKGNTVKADKLVVKGSDGLYYKLNVDAGATTSEKVTESDLQNGLHGTAIIAKTITAEKISVNDLVAFGADIAGFHITEQNTFYSGAKASINNTTQGIYMDATGQINIGDGSNFMKYYKAADGKYKLEISANSLILSSSGKTVESAIDEIDTAQTTANNAEEKASNAQTLIAQLSESISTLVTDGNGTSLMTQTAEGWTFSTADLQGLVNTISDNLNSLTEEVGDVDETVNVVKQAVDDLGVISEYVNITTYEDEPCIELGEADSEFKLRITNTQMMFTEGSTVLAYFTNQAFNSKKVVIEEELQQGGFVWKVRSNGNLGLTWKGGN